MAAPYAERTIRIDIEDGVITHNGEKCSVRLTRDGIRVGCTLVTIEAAKHLMDAHTKAFPPYSVVVLQ